MKFQNRKNKVIVKSIRILATFERAEYDLTGMEYIQEFLGSG